MAIIYSRREILKTMLLASGVTLMPLWRHAFAAQIDNPSPSRLVVVFLRGAVDGLSLVVPHGDKNYYGMRSSIAIAQPGTPDGAINLDGYFGLHPALSSLMPLWQAKQLAFVQASGSPDPSRSHFDAQANMESGTPGQASSDGWMNRVLATLPGPRSATEGLSFGSTLPLIMKGSVPVEVIGGNPGKPSVLDRPMVAQAFDRMYANQKDVIGQSYTEGQQARHEIATDLDEEQVAANNGAPLPGGAFAKNTAQLAKLMNKDGSVQVAFMALGGWDTHVGQGNGKGGRLTNILKPLGDGLAVLAQQLGPTWNNTVVMVVSEFGRTAHENGGGGTDHGHGNVMWLAGGAINGGNVYGEWPGLDGAHLYQGRDLAVTTDFRTVISAVLERHMRLPDAALAQIFPSAPTGTGRWGGIIRA